MTDSPANATQRSINRRTIAIYQWAVYATFAFIFAGLAITIFTDENVETDMGAPVDLFQKAIDLHPSGFFGIGIGIMILTPIVMVIDAAMSFYRGGNKQFALITSAVAVILGFSILLSFIWG